jgi:2-oxoglutarate ferredoxin oxidoreductase subunit gamma
MHEEITIAGSGGQGVLFMGRLLAEAGLIEGYEVVWLPSYGAEKRGGTVLCNVIISDQKIGSIFITEPTIAVAMNSAALNKLEPSIKPAGLLILNKSLIRTPVKREDVCTVYVPANRLAKELGGAAVSNLVLLGGLVARRPVVTQPSIFEAMENTQAKNKKYLAMNKLAFNRGYTLDHAD